jgi:cytochrome oxidase Cu insertion factor (SCO1/SenC/PrrC family)
MRTLESITPRNSATPLADIERLRASRDADTLASLLMEQSTIYAGRGSSEAEHLRGYILASFECAGLPASALPFVIEELDIGLNAYAVAAAAKALRGAHDVPDHVTGLLLNAIDRVRSSDDVVCFKRDAASPSCEAPTTALMELCRTLAWLGPRACDAAAPLKAMLAQQPPGFSAQVQAEIEKTIAALSSSNVPASAHCCGKQPRPVDFKRTVATPVMNVDIKTTQLQDQDGAIFSFGDFFSGRPGVLTFFYTRCMNPNKCSLTITKLALLQNRLDEQGQPGRFNIAAITYDPAFDTPARLRAYGMDRGMAFDDRNRLLRTTGAFKPLQNWLDLGVGYGTTTVNQHRLDIVVLGADGNPSTQISRVQWDEDAIVSALQVA